MNLTNNHAWMRHFAVLAALAVCFAAPAAAQKKSGDAMTAKYATAFTTITGSPLTVRVGDNQSFQVLNDDVPGVGQFYPNDSTSTADMGWVIRAGGQLFAPEFSGATSNLGTTEDYGSPVLGTVSGNGSSASPWEVTVDGTLGTTGLTARHVTTYVNGQNYYRTRMTLTNTSDSAQDARVFLAGDIFLAGDDEGIPTRQGASGAVGGSDCGATPSYHILFIPQTPANAWTGAYYEDMWGQVGGGQLDNALATGCIDNAAALQWNRSIAAGASVTVEAAVSFGEIPDIVGPPTSIAPVPTTGTYGLLLTMLAMMGAGWLVMRRR